MRAFFLDILRRTYNSPLKKLYHGLPAPLKAPARAIRSFVSGDPAPPESIPRVYPVLRCNLACPYCSDGKAYDQSDMGYKELTAARWIAIIDSIPGDAVIFTGGEPTLYRDLSEIINRIKKRDVRVYTNLVFNVEKFLNSLEKPVTFFTSFHPCNPSVTVEKNLKAVRTLLAHPMCKAISSHHLILDPANGTKEDFSRWKKMFKKEGVNLLLYGNQYDVNANSPDACAHQSRNKVRCSMDRIFLAPDGRRFICVSKMVRNIPDGAVPLDSKLPSIVCGEYGMCSPCDEVASVKTL
ncbi:radical SAM protein [Patescibacteria group bacterium]|nr:MAG: radical SAM protein [Patescibacteria group bacterium]